MKIKLLFAQEDGEDVTDVNDGATYDDMVC